MDNTVKAVKAEQFKHMTRYRWQIGDEVSRLTYPTPRLARIAGRKHMEKRNG